VLFVARTNVSGCKNKNFFGAVLSRTGSEAERQNDRTCQRQTTIAYLISSRDEFSLIRFSHVKFLMRQYQHMHMLYHLSIHFFLRGFFLEEDVCMTDSLDMILIL
jgi:hypothetical protein